MTKVIESPWINRIVGHGEASPEDLLAHPFNWRIHTRQQQAALAGAINDVGYIRSVTVNKTTGHVIDGHLRVTLAMRGGVKSIPVEYVELTEAEEAEALVTIDPIGAMAAADKANLDALLKQVQSDDAAVQQLLSTVAAKSGLIEFDPMNEWQGMPEFEQEDLEGFLLTVHFVNIEDKKEFADKLGIKITEATKSIWYPERPEEIMHQIPQDKVFTDES